MTKDRDNSKTPEIDGIKPESPSIVNSGWRSPISSSPKNNPDTIREALHQFAITYRPESRQTRQEDIDAILQALKARLEAEFRDIADFRELDALVLAEVQAALDRVFNNK